MLCKVSENGAGRFEWMPRGYEDDVKSLLKGWGLKLEEILCERSCEGKKCLTYVTTVDRFGREISISVCKKKKALEKT